MAFLTGLVLVDAPASALNNAGRAEEARTENAMAVKCIRTRQGAFPYVSAQAFRYWIRETLEKSAELSWKAAPVRKESENLAYSDGNPIEYWDDDLLGYMRAPGDQEGRNWATPVSPAQKGKKPVITRVSPFRVSTLVSLGPVSITDNFGSMTRHEGDPVLHQHEFYRAILKGLISLNLKAAGTFSYANRTGFRNLDEKRIEIAKEKKLEHLGDEKSYRLSWEQRIERITALLRALGIIYGGAKQALHYTDVTPAVFIAMVTKGGNNPLHYILGPGDKGQPHVHPEAVQQAFKVWKDQILSKLYVGWVQGFYDDQRARLESVLSDFNNERKDNDRIETVLGHPREVLEQLAKDIGEKKNEDWLR